VTNWVYGSAVLNPSGVSTGPYTGGIVPTGVGTDGRVTSAISTYATDTGAANAMAVTLAPAPASLASLTGASLRVLAAHANTGATTINVNALGAKIIVNPDGSTLTAGQIPLSGIISIVYDGTSFQLESITTGPLTVKNNTWSGTNTFSQSITATGGVASATRVTAVDPDGGGGFISTGTTAGGSVLKLVGNGGTTPTKWLRAINGVFQIINSAFTTAIINLTDAGALTTTAGITASSGNITASTGSVVAAAAVNAGTTMNVGTNLGVGGQIVANGLIQAGTSVTAANGNVLAQGGRLRASFGAAGSGDGNAGVILADFVASNGVNGFEKMPNGMFIQWGIFTTTTGFGDVFNFPTAFTGTAIQITGTDDGLGLADLGIGAINSGQAQVFAGFNNGAGHAVSYFAGVGVRWIAVGF
jgi:hypothetical protein